MSVYGNYINEGFSNNIFNLLSIESLNENFDKWLNESIDYNLIIESSLSAKESIKNWFTNLISRITTFINNVWKRIKLFFCEIKNKKYKAIDNDFKNSVKYLTSNSIDEAVYLEGINSRSKEEIKEFLEQDVDYFTKSGVENVQDYVSKNCKIFKLILSAYNDLISTKKFNIEALKNRVAGCRMICKYDDSSKQYIGKIDVTNLFGNETNIHTLQANKEWLINENMMRCSNIKLALSDLLNSSFSDLFSCTNSEIGNLDVEINELVKNLKDRLNRYSQSSSDSENNLDSILNCNGNCKISIQDLNDIVKILSRVLMFLPSMTSMASLAINIEASLKQKINNFCFTKPMSNITITHINHVCVY